MLKPSSLAVQAAFLCLLASPALAQNLLSNGDFDSSLAGWTAGSGHAWSAEDSDGEAGSGSVQITISSYGTSAVTQCRLATAGARYEFEYDVRIGVQGSASGRAGVVVRFFGDTVCGDALDATFPANHFATSTSASEWQQGLGAEFVAPEGTRSVLFEARATKTDSKGGSVTARLDDLALRQIGGGGPTTTLEEPICGNPVEPFDSVTASDALYILRASVEAVSCEPCVCDSNGSGDTTASDALVVLKHAIGVSMPLDCPVC